MKKEAEQDDGDRKPKKIKQFYTVRDVIKQNYQAHIQAEISVEPTDKKYIGQYQLAVSTVSTVLGKMTKKDHKEAEEIADLWNKQGAPPDLQLK